MRRFSSRAIALLTIVTAALLLAACSSPAAAPTQAPQPYASNTTGGASSDSLAASEGKQAAPGASDAQTGSGVVPWDRKIVRTSNVAMTVNDVEATMASIRDIAQVTESFVASSQTQYVGDKLTATVTLQVPVQAFDGVIQQVRKLAVKVDSELTSSQDVTEEYVDLQSQINNLKATEQSEVRLLDKATSMSDVLAIQRELTSVRGQIEQAQGRLNYLQRRSDYSTLTVRLLPVGAATEQSASTWQPLQTISRAWQASLETVSALMDALLSVVVFCWWLIPIVAVAFWLWRRGRRHRAPVAPASASTPPPSATSGSGPNPAGQ